MGLVFTEIYVVMKSQQSSTGQVTACSEPPIARAARGDNDHHSVDVLRALHWLPVHIQVTFKVASTCYRRHVDFVSTIVPGNDAARGSTVTIELRS